MKKTVSIHFLLSTVLGIIFLTTSGIWGKATAQKALLKVLTADQYSAIVDPRGSWFLTYGDYGFELGYYSSEYLTRQQWLVKNGYIQLKQSGEYLTANAKGYPYLSKYQQNSNAQKWEVKQVDHERSYIKSVSTGKFLSVQNKKVSLSDRVYYFHLIDAWPVKKVRIYAEGDPALMKKVVVYLSSTVDGMRFQLPDNKFNGNSCIVDLPYNPAGSSTWNISIYEPEMVGKGECYKCYSKTQDVQIDARTERVDFKAPIRK